MDCTLATLVACFSWSNLYLDATTDFIRDREPRYIETYGELLHALPLNGNPPYLQRDVIREIGRNDREIESPYGRVALGYETDLSNLRIDVSAFYQESMAVRDRGEVGASVRVRWFPFGGKRRD